MSILDGFIKDQSDNLPKIDALSMFSFLGKNRDFTGAELRGAKAKRSGRESYGDSAIGYVQVKRETNLCRVKAIVTPLHKITKKGYGVTVICNEEDEVVLSALCDSCAVSLGEYNGFPDLNYIYLL
ncbi:hypothetical protein AVEN_220889-1 [Araneus ventricosus]|uniref:Uncharacterized protein n=1 Tax=Araneus ventricosus TaxID=182803 RepID=A0A4Y2HXD1_ARAVE|nr:hypothetical protein AVEN_220889-1 [Araneus ventricosus]